MTWIDWLIVFALNGSVMVYGLFLARGAKTSRDWFLGNRSLAWWAVGMSMFATNVDNADPRHTADLQTANGILANIDSVGCPNALWAGSAAGPGTVPAAYPEHCRDSRRNVSVPVGSEWITSNCWW